MSGRGSKTGKLPAKTTKRAQKAFANAQERLAKAAAETARQLALKATLAALPDSTEPAAPTPRDTPAPADPLPQATAQDAQHLALDLPVGPGASKTLWDREAEIRKLVPKPTYSTAALLLAASTHAVLEQLSVLQACAAALAESQDETATAILIGSEGLAEALSDTIQLVANEPKSSIMGLLLSGAPGRLLIKPLQWTSEAVVQASTEALARLQRAVPLDVLRFEKRRENQATALLRTRALEEGELSLPEKKKRGRKTAAFAEPMHDDATAVVDLTQSEQLAAMARRGRRTSAAYDENAVAARYPVEDLAGSSPRPRGRRSDSPDSGSRGCSPPAERLEWRGGALPPDHHGGQAGGRSRSAPTAARGHALAEGAAGRAHAAAAAAAADRPPAGADRSAPALADGVVPYGPPPRVGRTGLGALAEALRRSYGEPGTGAHDTDRPDDLDQELIGGGGRHSVLDQMRRSVPPLEHCLPLYQQLERQQAREAHAIATKTKLLKHATYPLDLHLFQLATAQYRDKYLSYSHRAAAEHVEYVLRLSQHWANRKCATLLRYDQAVREHVYLNTLSFAAATETQELWLRIVLPDVIRAAARPQTGGGYADRSGQHREGVVGSCGHFVSPEGCPHARHQVMKIDPSAWTPCPYGSHECDTCTGASDYDITCRKCHAKLHPRNLSAARQQQQQRPQGQRQQQGQQGRGGFALRPEAPPYSGASRYPQGGPQGGPQSQQQQQQFPRNVRQRHGGGGGRGPA